jgi:hypothetical protein
LKEELKYGNNDYNNSLAKLGTTFSDGMKFFNESIAERYATEEWTDIMKFTKLNSQQLDQLNKHPAFTTIIDSLELMNRVVIDKNNHIKNFTT